MQSIGVPLSRDQLWTSLSLNVPGAGAVASIINAPAGPDVADGTQPIAAAPKPTSASSVSGDQCGAAADHPERPLIPVSPGELHREVDRAERALSGLGRYFQRRGQIVEIQPDPMTGHAAITPISEPELKLALSEAAQWEAMDKKTGQRVPTDPPRACVQALLNSRKYRHLPILVRLAPHPYFGEIDGVLVLRPGYDPMSHLFGVFDPAQFAIPDDPTQEVAKNAATKLEALLNEFPFDRPEDKATALSAIFTAVARVTLPHAPAFHVTAPTTGIGKTYLCQVIAAFAAPSGCLEMSYPTSGKEGMELLVDLASGPEAVLFDEMQTGWVPQAEMKQLLTADRITANLTGVGRTTLLPRTLFLGSGTNVGPEGDMRRRVATIGLGTLDETPATRTYMGAPLDLVRQRRSEYVAAVLTVLCAYRHAGSPRTAVANVVTYGGAWDELCRQPLLWLGYADPATSLLEQLRRNPADDPLNELLAEWHRAWGADTMLVRDLVPALAKHPGILTALRELPVFARADEVSKTKLGKYLGKHKGRVINGLRLEQVNTPSREGWRVVPVPQPLPGLPPCVAHEHAPT